MEYISKEYEQQLNDLAESLMAARRARLAPAVGELSTQLQLALETPEQ